jgi:hypothetical protein
MSSPVPQGFSAEEVWTLLASLRALSPDLVLVGGQALAFWARYYDVQPPAELVPYVTLDLDFLGDAADARAFASALPGARVYVASLDDHTPSSARLVADDVFGKPLEIDFLHSLAGLSERDVRRQSITIESPDGTTVRVMHPLYCLESRIKNLILLPSKRDRYGLAQAALAVPVLRAHLSTVGSTTAGARQALKIAERVVELALSEPGKRCFLQYGIEVLESIPVDSIRSAEFRNRRWPQVLQLVGMRRTVLRRLLEAAGQRKRRRT